MNTSTLSHDLNALKLHAFASAWDAWNNDPALAKQGAQACLRFLVDAHRQAAAQASIDKFFREARLATHFALCTFNAPAGSLFLDQLQSLEWLKRNHNVVLTGPSLSGKTHLAAALGREATLHGVRTKLVQVPLMLDRLMDPELPSRVRRRYFKELSRVPLLILDDFATERADEESMAQLRRLLDERGRLGLPLVVTSVRHQLDWDEAFEEAATREGIYARVRSPGCHFIQLKRRAAAGTSNIALE